MTKHWFSDVKAFQLDPLGLLTERALNSDAEIFPLSLGPAPVFFVNNPALVKPLLKTNEEILDKGRLVKKISKVVGNSSLTLSGDAHRKRRAVLHERMSRGVANTYVSEMAANIRAVSAQLAKEDSFRAGSAFHTLVAFQGALEAFPACCLAFRSSCLVASEACLVASEACLVASAYPASQVACEAFLGA